MVTRLHLAPGLLRGESGRQRRVAENRRMDQGYVQLGGVLLGGVIVLAGAVLAHVFAARREAKNRALDHLREVARELQKRLRISLEIVQLVKVGLRERTPAQFNDAAFSMNGWKEAMLAAREALVADRRARAQAARLKRRSRFR